MQRSMQRFRRSKHEFRRSSLVWNYVAVWSMYRNANIVWFIGIRLSVYAEMYCGIYSNLSIRTENQNPLSDAEENASLFKWLGYNTPEYQRMGRIAYKAERWAEVMDATSWTGILLLRDPMPPIWFERSTNNTQWEHILGVINGGFVLECICGEGCYQIFLLPKL